MQPDNLGLSHVSGPCCGRVVSGVTGSPISFAHSVSEGGRAGNAMPASEEQTRAFTCAEHAPCARSPSGFTYLILTTAFVVATAYDSHFIHQEMEAREVERLGPGHTAGSWQSQRPNCEPLPRQTPPVGESVPGGKGCVLFSSWPARPAPRGERVSRRAYNPQ